MVKMQHRFADITCYHHHQRHHLWWGARRRRCRSACRWLLESWQNEMAVRVWKNKGFQSHQQNWEHILLECFAQSYNRHRRRWYRFSTAAAAHGHDQHAEANGLFERSRIGGSENAINAVTIEGLGLISFEV
jgi:hypothetical protein